MAQFKAISAKRPFEKTKSGGGAAGRPPNPRQRRQRNADGEYDDPDESKPRAPSASSSAQKLVFDDEGNTVAANSQAGQAAQAAHRHQDALSRGGAADVDTKWFEVYAVHNTNAAEPVEMKESEQQELSNACRTSFEAELAGLQKSE